MDVNYIGKYTSDFTKLQPHLEKFEQNLKDWYPIGDDYFYISHGLDYFAFFRRLGELHYIIATNNREIIGGMAGIQRTIQDINKGYHNVWYLCDLKVDKKYQGQSISKKIFGKALYVGTGGKKFYSISMYPTSKKIMHLLEYIKYVGIKPYGYLYIYSYDYNDMMKHHKKLEKRFGKIFYACLKDKKDIILKSTGQSMNLLHLQHNTFYDKSDENNYLQQHLDYKHILCLHESDPLNEILNNHTTKALIIGMNMNQFNWDFILTSDI